MSAYVCSRSHIVTLVQSAMSRRFNPYGGTFSWFCFNTRQLPCSDYDRAAEVANMLWEENIKSVLARYPNDTRDSMPGPNHENYQITAADFCAMFSAPAPVSLLKSIQCYEYQSCEHDEWTSSEAHAFCRNLVAAAIRVLPGYDAAPWGDACEKPERPAPAGWSVITS
jgi:hypothetical protein